MRKRNRDELELGISILQHVESQLNRADSKAQFTFTLDTLLIASSAFLGRGTGIAMLINMAPISHKVAALFTIAMFITLLLSTIYALLAVIPRLTPKNNAGNNIFYFGNIVQWKKEDFIKDYVNQSDREVERMLRSEIYDLSRIAERKFSLIRISHIFLFFSLGFWSTVQVISMFIN